MVVASLKERSRNLIGNGAEGSDNAGSGFHMCREEGTLSMFYISISLWRTHFLFKTNSNTPSYIRLPKNIALTKRMSRLFARGL